MKKDKVQHLRNEPLLRFNDFSSPYLNQSLKSVTRFIKDGTHASLKDTASDNYKYLLSAKNIKHGKITYDFNDRKISLEDYNKIYSNYSLSKGDILLSIVGSIGDVAVMQEDNNQIAFQRSVGIIRPSDDVECNYLNYYIQTLGYQLQLLKRKNASAQGGIYLNELGKTKISYPSTEEQRKVSRFLSAIDSKISSLEDNLENLKLFKKGLLEKIYNNLNVEETRLKNYVFSKEDIDFCDENKYLEISGINVKTKLYNISDKLPVNGSKRAKKGAILISSVRPTRGAITKLKQSIMVSSALIQIYGKDRLINSEYLYQILTMEKFFRKMGQLSTGGTYPTINVYDVLSYKIKVPNINFQIKIGKKMLLLDNDLFILTNKLAYFKNFKKGLLQQMFI